MFPSPCSTTTQDLLLTLNNRRLLLHSPLYYAATPPTSNHTATTPDDYTTPANGFDANVIMVLSVLLCALFCSLGLNSIVRCALTCSTFLTRNSNNNHNTNNGNNRDINSAALVGGVKKKALKTFPTVSFSVDLNLPGLDSECVICLSEFVAGELVRLLPKCSHGFHVRCIDRWLDAHSSCPTCRSCLIDTCHKIVGPCNAVIQASSSESSPTQPRETVINVTPLEREDMIHTSTTTNN